MKAKTTNPHSTGAGQEPLIGMNPRIILLAVGMFALGTDAFIVAGVLPVITHETGATAHTHMGFAILPGDAQIDGVAVTTNYGGRGSDRVLFRRDL